MKLYILEDEILIQQHLLSVLKDIPYVKVVGSSDEVAKAVKEIPELKPELVLADIRLKDGDSFNLFSKIETHDFQIIFLTAYDEYAIKALNLGAFAYLLKPLDENELRLVLDKCFRQSEHERFTKMQLDVSRDFYHSKKNNIARRLALKSQDYIEIVSVDDIIFCKSDKGYTTFYFKDKRHILVSRGLKDYENILEPMGFLRCHQSYLVNPAFIKKYFKEGTLQMQNGENIPVSTRKKEEITRYLEQLT